MDLVFAMLLFFRHSSFESASVDYQYGARRELDSLNWGGLDSACAPRGSRVVELGGMPPGMRAEAKYEWLPTDWIDSSYAPKDPQLLPAVIRAEGGFD